MNYELYNAYKSEIIRETNPDGLRHLINEIKLDRRDFTYRARLRLDHQARRKLAILIETESRKAKIISEWKAPYAMLKMDEQI